jgi:glycosyltransferase involved in cell wall biosynthesis
LRLKSGSEDAPLSPQPKRILLIYLGRRGAMSQFALELARVARERVVVVVARQNELYGEIAAAGAPVVAVDTFSTAWEAFARIARIFAIRRRIVEVLREYGADMAVTLMPHVWTPLIAPAIKRAGARYLVIAHDAQPHPGDRTALVNRWLMRDIRQADRVITLSEHVARQLIEQGAVPRERVRLLFLPVLGAGDERSPSTERQRVGFLFFGRILKYKGLPLFVEACEALRAEELSFDIGVVGEGEIGPWRQRLLACGAEIINHWIAHREIASIMRRYDAIVVPSIEASQSGVIPAAQGHGLPAIVTPVGGLTEQIIDGATGLVASAASASAIAAQMRRFLLGAELRRQLRDGVRARRDATSIASFVDALTALS